MNIRMLGMQPYNEVWQKMKDFTLHRDLQTPDELWLLEHFPVYTQGQAGKPEHILNPQSIPVIQSDRGGQVTYHGPGQLVAYVLMDLRRQNIGIRTLVTRLECILIEVLARYDLNGRTQCGAPGVYIDHRKIASVGLRVKNGCTYHGIALNVDMDLSPFSGINPCGFTQMQMTQISHYHPSTDMKDVCNHLMHNFLSQFNNLDNEQDCMRKDSCSLVHERGSE